jgi:isoquinoline 1-oxidoreductase alpha subunit
MSFALLVNGQSHLVEDDGDTPLLWVLRDRLSLIGSKYGCGVAQCGACTVHLDGQPKRSCSIPLKAATRRRLPPLKAPKVMRFVSSRPHG